MAPAPKSYGARDHQRADALTRDGFVFYNQRGSHQRYRHADGRRVTVTFHHASDTFPIGTLRSMIELQARWTEDDLRRLSLIR
jgi:predicted RNA binding protein YcfA (HicA-like mRNA interferase family)